MLYFSRELAHIQKTLVSKEFHQWVKELSARYKAAQIKASIAVNAELIRFYYELGKSISERNYKSSYGNRFYEVLSNELATELPNVQGLSPQNLRYTEKFYSLYQSSTEIFPQLVGELFSIPWGHHRTIIDKCKTSDKAVFFVRKCIEGNWSRSVLENYLRTDLFERSGKAITNFTAAPFLANGTLAQEISRDPYSFNFLSVLPNYNEKNLKDALTNNIQRFLLELGNGFAFIGREVRMLAGKTELFGDLLFYHTKLHCYVAVEVKTRKFKPEDLGQLCGYVAAINHSMRTEGDGPTIGLLICKEKDDVLARYCLENFSAPLGISQYDLPSLLPNAIESDLPTEEEIEKGIKSIK